MTNRELDNRLRAKYLNKIKELFGEDALPVGSNEITVPCVDEEGNDKYINIIVKVPFGSRDGDEYDGYSMADAYRLKCEKDALKEAKKAEEKAKKIAKSKAKTKPKKE